MLGLINLEDLFAKSDNAICINEIPADVESFNDYVVTQLFYDMSGQLDFSASCLCGHLTGNFNIGLTCPICNTDVTSEFINTIAHKNWLGIPITMPKVMHPIVFMVLKNFLGKYRHLSLIDYLLNPDMILPDSLSKFIPKQGYTYFYQNYDEIMNFFFTKYTKTFIKNNKYDDRFRMFFEKYRDITFTSKLAILDPALHPVSKHGSSKMNIDKFAIPILNAINSLTYSQYEIRKSIVSKNYADKVLYKVYTNYMQYIDGIIASKLGSKPGFLRKQMYGIRAHWSCRAVDIPFIDCVYADELKIPWVNGLNILKLPVMNFLIHKYNYSWPNAYMKIKAAFVQYDAEIDHIMNEEIIKNYKSVDNPNLYGLPCIHNRNPY
jgi:hypothetical protein